MYKSVFRYCPKCRHDCIEYDGLKCFTCLKCGWVFFHNSAAAVMAVIVYNGKILFLKRAMEPKKGQLDLPGGFVDPGESAEQAVQREIYEETGLEITAFQYLGSSFNMYEFKGIVYPTCDLIYTAAIETLPITIDKTEADELLLLSLDAVQFKEIAFDSAVYAVKLYEQYRF